MKSSLLAFTVILFFNSGSLVFSACNPPKSVCTLKKDSGPCDEYYERYYFDLLAGRECKKFIYGGCWGNGNRFATLEACNKTCTCFLPAVRGPCEARIQRYHFNYCTQKCEQFFYGGCHGNANNFQTETECYKTCPCNQFHEFPRVNLNAICYLPKEVGPCKALVPRYYYNKCTKQCEFFYFGGCGGNRNNFKSLKACNSMCYYPPVKG